MLPTVAEHSHLPHLRPFAQQPIVFLTTVTHQRRSLLASSIACETLTNIWRRSPTLDGWYVGDFLFMPDHVHLFARPAVEAKSLARWVETWKSIGARTLATALKIRPPLWQADYFDRFLRSTDNYSEKWDYVQMNPVRAGLCARPEDWPWKGCLFELTF